MIYDMQDLAIGGGIVLMVDFFYLASQAMRFRQCKNGNKRARHFFSHSNDTVMRGAEFIALVPWK